MPSSGKQRRRMLRAALWRLAKLVHAQPSKLSVMDEPELRAVVNAREDLCDYGGGGGQALRLVKKIGRLGQR